jgi:hypothetical protein
MVYEARSVVGPFGIRGAGKAGMVADLEKQLSPWEKRALVLLAVFFVWFGVSVEYRSAFLTRRMTDLGVYLRAAWSVRDGQELYDVTDNNGWHYLYPPLFAILLTPFADPPPGVYPEADIPFEVSVALWYLFSIVCLLAAVHSLASALEETSSDPRVRGQPRGCRRWWALRVIPVVVCLPAIGQTLSRGQVNLLLLAILCGMAAAAIRGRSFRAGLWLAGAVCLKIIPGFLLLYPLWRRDGKWLAGWAVGMLVGYVAVPAAVLGPQRAWEYHHILVAKVLGPGVGRGGDHTLDDEIMKMTRNDSQSFMAAIHNAIHPDRWTRPEFPTKAVRIIALALGILMMVLTLAAAGWRTRHGPAGEVQFLGALVIVMLLSSPICHQHYFCMSIPLVMGLAHRSGLSERALAAVFTFDLLVCSLPILPPLEILRDVGSSMYGNLALWGVGVGALWRAPGRTGKEDETHPVEPLAA